MLQRLAYTAIHDPGGPLVGAAQPRAARRPGGRAQRGVWPAIAFAGWGSVFKVRHRGPVPDLRHGTADVPRRG
jgi:hypothetical protein